MSQLDDREILDNYKHVVHKKFDMLWKSGFISRSSAYTWLCVRLALRASKAHFTSFNMEQLKKADQEIEKFIVDNKLTSKRLYDSLNMTNIKQGGK